MDAPATRTDTLLAELRNLAPSQRSDRLRAAATDADGVVARYEILDWIIRLADEAERLAHTEVAVAIESTAMVLALADELGTARERSRARRASAQALAYAGRFAEALPVYESAVSIADEAGLAVDAARARMSSAHALNAIGRTDESITTLTRAGADFEAAGETQLAARADANLGATYADLDRPAEALRCHDRARARMQNDPVALAQVDSNRGFALVALDRFTEAEQAYLSALPVLESNGMDWAAAIVAGNLAEVAVRQGRLQSALQNFERTIRFLERDDAPAEMARVLAERAEALEVLGLPGSALQAYQAALPELDRHGLAIPAARALAATGRMLLRLNRFEESRDAMNQATKRFIELDQKTELARVCLARLDLALATGDIDSADKCLRDAGESLESRPTSQAMAKYFAARIALARSRPTEAAALASEGLRLLASEGAPPLIADLLHLRGRARLALGMNSEGVADLRAAVQNVERVRGALQAERFRASFHGNRSELYEDWVRGELVLGGPDECANAFIAIERAKSRTLLDLAHGIGSDDPGLGATTSSADDQRLHEEAGALRARISQLYSRLADAAFGETTESSVWAWRGELVTIESRLGDLDSRLQTSSSTRELGTKALTIAEASAIASPDTAIIEYFVASGELLALVICNGKNTLHRRLGDVEELAEFVRRVQFQVRRALRPGATEGARGERLVTDAQRELHAIYNRLIAPLARDIGAAKQLVIVPHGPLHALPLHALWDGACYLTERFEISYAPSVSVFAQLSRGRSEAPTSRAAVVGVADASAPEIEREARIVADLLGTPGALIGSAATAEDVIKTVVGKKIVHFACHGHFDAENPGGSGLRLADRWLTPMDLHRVHLDADLVTLSGCETGRNLIAAGDELLGLVRAFIGAGARALLVSLWTVNDSSTSELMCSFYQALRTPATGKKPAEALRLAQLEVMARKPHPAFWAPFVLVGAI